MDTPALIVIFIAVAIILTVAGITMRRSIKSGRSGRTPGSDSPDSSSHS
jgi:hypothetical protein